MTGKTQGFDDIQANSTAKADTLSHAYCRICENTVTDYPSAPVRGYNLTQCINCGFVQVAEKPSDDEIAAIYQEAYFGHNKYRDEATLRVENLRRLKLLQSHATLGGRILEAGCGDGSFLAHAGEHYEACGFDLSAHGVEIAKAKNPDIAEHIRVGSLEDQDYPPNWFDAICCWDVIEHVWDPRTTGEKMLYHLKPGGSLLLSTPNIGALMARLMGKRWAFMTPPEHLSFFSKLSMKQLFEVQLGATLVEWHSLGKRANLGFIMYKARRVMPVLPESVLRLFDNPSLSKLSVYVPTGDIQYVVVRKS